MCGFVVIRSKNLTDSMTLQKMQKNISHRGDDDSGIVFVDTENNYRVFDSKSLNKLFYTGFAFQRLSIQDLSISGHQPMISENKRFLIVFNGEVYNFKEIRKELISIGYKFYSN